MNRAEAAVFAMMNSTGTRRGLFQRAAELAGSTIATQPFLAATTDMVARRASQGVDLYETIAHPDADREVNEYIGGRPEATIETHPEIFKVDRVDWGDLPQDPTHEAIASGLLRSDGESFLGLELKGFEDPLFSCPFFSIICNGVEYHFGMPQGDGSDSAQLVLGFLPGGESIIQVRHTDYSRFLNQDDPKVSLFELKADHPLMRDFVLPSLPEIGEKTYSDSPLALGFRQDAPIGRDLKLYLGDEDCVQVLNGENIAEKVGNPHRILRGRIKKGDYPKADDIDAKQVGKARLSDAACQELGYQRDIEMLGKQILSHRLRFHRRYHPPQQLRQLRGFRNMLQEVGEHGLLDSEVTSNIFHNEMPQFSGYMWRGDGWDKAVGLANLRALLITGALDKDDEMIDQFIEEQLNGDYELLKDERYWAR